MTLDGTTSAFTTLTNSQPTGLILGNNYFFADVASGSIGTLASDSYTSWVNNTALGNVVEWMAVTFTGLAAGIYAYDLAGLTSANWTNINSLATNWSGTLVIPGSAVNGVPESGVLAWVGLAWLGYEQAP